MIDLFDPKVAMIIISLAALGMNVISGLLTKYLVYTPDYVQKRAELDRFRREYEEARRRGDKKRLRKLEKRRAMMKRLESELALKSLRPFIITLAIFWLIWWALSTLYSGLGQFVLFPFPLPLIGMAGNYFWWYLISSVAFSPVTRALLRERAEL